MTVDLQEYLNKYCLILRKYNLDNENGFFGKFSELKKDYLINAWKYSFEKIQNREIIKDASELRNGAEEIIRVRLENFQKNNHDTYYYLNSTFDVKELKLDDERIERRFRNILAIKHNNNLEQVILRKHHLNSVNFYARIEKKIIDINETFEVNFSVNHKDAENFSSPSFKHFDIIKGPNLSVQNQWISGISIFNKNYSYTLKPKFETNLKIEPASIYLGDLVFKTKELNIQVVDKKAIKRKNILDSIRAWATLSIFPLLFITIFFGSRIRDGFTTVDVLTERIYERSVYKYNGSRCRDGTDSRSQGRGTCSWHGGVRFKFYKGQHKKSKQECRIEAKERSWIE